MAEAPAADEAEGRARGCEQEVGLAALLPRLLPRAPHVWLRFPALLGCSRSSETAAFRASAAHRCSDVTACNPWSVSNAAMRCRAVGQNFGHLAWPRRDHFQVHSKSRLPGQMSRIDKKVGRFGLALVSYSASPRCAPLAHQRA